MSELPAPLVPIDTDIKGLDGFLLDTDKLLASELWALSTGEEFKAAVGLWMRAWKQTPPGSLPDDERVLASFSGAGPRWKKVRDIALRGFVKCSDGRLYNITLCADVLRAAKAKAERHVQTKAATEARQAKREALRQAERDAKRNETPNDNRNDNRNDLRNVLRNVVPEKGREGKEDPTPIPPDGFDHPEGVTPITPAVAAVIGVSEAAIESGIETVMRQGQLSRPAAQTFIAQLCKQHGDPAVIEQLGYLAVNPKVEPRSWLKAALNGGSNAPHLAGHRNRTAAERVRDANPIAPDPEIDRYF